jgi:predicted transcriptional regulator YdeE
MGKGKVIELMTNINFSVNTSVENAIAAAWRKIWTLPLSRAYTFDFEKYNLYGTVQIYISVKKYL